LSVKGEFLTGWESQSPFPKVERILDSTKDAKIVKDKEGKDLYVSFPSNKKNQADTARDISACQVETGLYINYQFLLDCGENEYKVFSKENMLVLRAKNLHVVIAAMTRR
jgi:hypothetical protein